MKKGAIYAGVASLRREEFQKADTVWWSVAVKWAVLANTLARS